MMCQGTKPCKEYFSRLGDSPLSLGLIHATKKKHCGALYSVNVSLFAQVPPDRPRFRLPLEPDVPRASDPPHRHRQREGRRQGVPKGGGAGYSG